MFDANTVQNPGNCATLHLCLVEGDDADGAAPLQPPLRHGLQQHTAQLRKQSGSKLGLLLQTA